MKNTKLLGISTLALAMVFGTSFTAFAQVQENTPNAQKIEIKSDVFMRKPFIGFKGAKSQEEFLKKMDVSLMEELKAKMEEHRQKVEQALENADYQAWKQVISENGHEDFLAEKITEENFPKFVEMHKHMKEAEKIAEELGLPVGRHVIMKSTDGHHSPGKKIVLKIQE